MQFFIDRPELVETDLKDIALNLTFKHTLGMREVIKYGDKGDKFYIILKGVTSVKVPNPEIMDRAAKLKDFQFFKFWKENIFDPKAKKAEQDIMESYQDQIKK